MPPRDCLTGPVELDELTKQTQAFLYDYIKWPHVEIEARFGTIIDKNTQQRLNMPVTSECVLKDGMNEHIRFESNVSQQLHRHFNQMLN